MATTEASRERDRRYRERNADKLKEKRKARSAYMKEYQRKWYLEKREAIIAKQTAYYHQNKARVISYVKDWQKRNRSSVTKRQAAWVAKRRKDPAYLAQRSKVCTDWIKRKRREDPVFRAVENLRRRLRSYVMKKSDRMLSLIGCTVNELRAHLASQFEPWMNWENYGFGPGKWVVDHIRPCAAFDLSDEKQQRECFHFSNLRPLCWRKNIEKSDS